MAQSHRLKSFSTSILESIQSDDHKAILIQLGHKNAKLLGEGGEGIAYKSGNKVIKISHTKAEGKDDNDLHAFFPSIDIDKSVLSDKKAQKYYAKIYDIGYINGYYYSIKEFLNPIPQKIYDEIDAIMKEYLESNSLEYYADAIWHLQHERKKLPKDTIDIINKKFKGLLEMIEVVINVMWKNGYESDLGSANMGVDKSGNFKVFDG